MSDEIGKTNGKGPVQQPQQTEQDQDPFIVLTKAIMTLGKSKSGAFSLLSTLGLPGVIICLVLLLLPPDFVQTIVNMANDTITGRAQAVIAINTNSAILERVTKTMEEHERERRELLTAIDKLADKIDKIEDRLILIERAVNGNSERSQR